MKKDVSMMKPEVRRDLLKHWARRVVELSQQGYELTFDESATAVDKIALTKTKLAVQVRIKELQKPVKWVMSFFGGPAAGRREVFYRHPNDIRWRVPHQTTPPVSFVDEEAILTTSVATYECKRRAFDDQSFTEFWEMELA